MRITGIYLNPTEEARMNAEEGLYSFFRNNPDTHSVTFTYSEGNGVVVGKNLTFSWKAICDLAKDKGSLNRRRWKASPPKGYDHTKTVTIRRV